MGVLEELEGPNHWRLEFRSLWGDPQETIATGDVAAIKEIFSFIKSLAWWPPRHALVFGMRNLPTKNDASLALVLQVVHELQGLPQSRINEHCRDFPYHGATGPFLRLYERA